MDQLILHAGTVKTGTTYLQKTIYENRDVFARHGLTYPFVFQPDLHLPRYTNAQFLYNRSRDREARKLITSAEKPLVLISEEGIFGYVENLRHPAFEGLPKKIVLYIRPTAELLCAWAAEMSEPYNVFAQLFEFEHPTRCKLLPFFDMINAASHEYAVSIGRFMNIVDEIGRENFIIRPFEPQSFENQDLLTDFLGCIGLDAEAVRSDPDFRDPGPTNASRSRKFTDISRAVWRNLNMPRTLERYNLQLVEEVAQACSSGDPRDAVETLTDAEIEWFTGRFEHFESFISKTFLDGAPLFINRYPACFGQEREPYRPIDPREVELLTELKSMRCAS